MRPERMVEVCRQRGVDVLAVTDHNQLEGALELQKLAPFRVIPSEEIRTSEGEIIGYFLREYVAPGQSPEETARQVRDQGGIVGVPHPFDALRSSAIRREALDRLVSLGLVDLIEAFNARMVRPQDNDRALAYAHEHGLPVVAGSDAHTYAEIGAACVEIRPFDGAQDFLEAVREGVLSAQLSPWPVHLASTWAKVSRKMGIRNVRR